MTEPGPNDLELVLTGDGYIGSITCRGPDGAVAWQAMPPEGERDAWVSVNVEHDVVTATSWSGWQVQLSLSTGAEVARNFTK